MSPPASLSFKGQATKQATVKWSISTHDGRQVFLFFFCLSRFRVPVIELIFTDHFLLPSQENLFGDSFLQGSYFSLHFASATQLTFKAEVPKLICLQ